MKIAFFVLLVISYPFSEKHSFASSKMSTADVEETSGKRDVKRFEVNCQHFPN